MTLFDEIYNYYPDVFLTPGLSEISVAEGVIAILLASVMTTDTLMSEDAVRTVSDLVLRMNFFKRYSQDDVEEMFARVGDFYKRYGAKPVIAETAKVVPLWLRESVFAIAADLVPFDRQAKDWMTLFRMVEALKIPKEVTECVFEAKKIKRRAMTWNGSKV